jgi:hypothetical protein
MGLAFFFWRGDLQGLGQLFFALIGMGILQAALALGVMFCMYKLFPDKFHETTYAEFDFANFQEPAFLNFIYRLAVIFGGTTLALHLLEYLIVYREIIRHWWLITFLMFLLETGAIAAGQYYIFRLDKHRLFTITAFSALAYLMLFAMLRRFNLLI